MAKRKFQRLTKAASPARRARAARSRAAVRKSARPLIRRQSRPRGAAAVPAPAPRRHVSLVQRTARQTRRGFKRQRKEISRLTRALRQGARSRLRRLETGIAGFQRRTHQAARRAVRHGVNGAAARITATRRGLRQGIVRKVRRARDWMSRKAERKLYDAQDTMQRTFRPVVQNVAPYHRTVLAGGAAAVAVVLISFGWMALFDRATAVPNRTPQRAEIVSPVSASSEPTLPADAVPAAPAPRAPAAKKDKTERGATQDQGRATHRQRHSTRSSRQHRSETAGTEAFASAGGADVDGSNSLIAEARRYLGTNPTGRASLWCGAFMDLVLRQTGHQGGGNLAMGYAHYGTRVQGPEIGAIAVMGRRGGGHVGVVSGIDPNGNPIVISGNHNRTVAEAVYPRQRIITYVMPN